MDHIARQELASRWDRCRMLLKQHLPQAEGLVVFSRLNIYYFTGTFANGLFWLPLSGEPVLLCRRGFVRAKLESPLDRKSGLAMYSQAEKLGKAFLVTKSEDDFGMTHLPGIATEFLKIPAHILCYLLGQAERIFGNEP